MAEYLIQGETLKAIANKIRVYISKIGDSTHTINPNIVADDKTFIEDAIKVYYSEDIDSNDLDFMDYVKSNYGDIIGFDYIENAEGYTVPVIYFYQDEEEYTEPHFYVGMDVINGEIYDKWRKIELTDGEGGEIGSSDSEYNYTWDSDMKKYVYTNRVVVCVNEEDELFSPTDFPSKIEDVYNAGCNARGDKPNEVSTEAEMTALLETSESGSIFKFTGESTDTYENGALYILEEVVE